MTREDVKGIFPNASDEEITEFLNKHNGEIATAKAGKIKADELKILREKAKKYDDYEADKLSVEEKAKKVLKEAEDAKREGLKLLNKSKAIQEFSNAGFKEDDYKDIINGIVSDDEEKTVNTAKSFVSVMSKQKSDMEAQFKEQYLKNIHKPQGGGIGDEPKKTEAENLAESLSKSSASAIKLSSENLKSYLK